VQAIQHAEPTPESAELPLTEEVSEGTDLEQPVAVAPEETQLESERGQQEE
jgi:hypothetical protein